MPKGGKSKYSNFFQKIGGDGGAKCLLCGSKKKEVKIKMTHNCTTGLKSHLRAHHKKEFEQLFGEESEETSSGSQRTIEAASTSSKVSTLVSFTVGICIN